MIDLYISVQTKDGAGELELNNIAENLAKDLMYLDVLESIEPLRNKQTETGEKGSGIVPGNLWVKIIETSGFGNLIGVLGSFLKQDKNRSLKLQIGENSLEVTKLSKADQKELIEWFKIQTGMKFEK